MARAILMPSELSATALLRSARGTSSGTIDCRRPHQRRADATDEGQRDQVVDRQRAGVRQSSSAADRGQQQLHEDQEAAAVQDVGQHAGRWRRAGRWAAWRRSGSAPRRSGWPTGRCQELATSRMKLPTLPSTVAAHSTANTGWRSGAKLPAGLGVLPCGMERLDRLGSPGAFIAPPAVFGSRRAGGGGATASPAGGLLGRVGPMRSPCVTRSASFARGVTA